MADEGEGARRIVVAGRVQGVGYRVSCARVATALGLVGHVRNLADGRVEVVAAGPIVALDRLVEWCRSGPAGASVSEVSTGPATGPGEAPPAFRILR